MSKFSGFVRSHLGAAIAAVATAVVFVGGVLILTLVGGGGTPAAAGNTTTTTTVAPARSRGSGAKGAGTALRRQGVRGVITTINGNTWTVMSAAGVPATVQVTAATTFGTKNLPLTAGDFSDGDHIVVLGTRSGSTVTATRIAKVVAQGGASATTTTIPGG